MTAFRSLSLATATVAATFMLALTGCATSSPDVVSRSQAQHMQSVRGAVVESMRPVVVDGAQSGLGAVAGGLVGAIAGSGIGGRRDGMVGGVLGAVAGGALGNAIERSTTRENAVELVLRLDDGSRQVIVQSDGAQQFFEGDRVQILGSSGRYRVARSR